MGAWGGKPVRRKVKAADSINKKWQAQIPTTKKAKT